MSGEQYAMPWYENTERVTNNIKDFFDTVTHPEKLITKAWEWFMARAYWLTVILIAIMIIYYATTKDTKCIKKGAIILVTYCILKGIDLVV